MNVYNIQARNVLNASANGFLIVVRVDPLLGHIKISLRSFVSFDHFLKERLNELFQIGRALHIRARFIVVQFTIIDHEHEIRKQHLFRLVMIVLTNALFNRH